MGSPHRGVNAVCDKCEEIDERITRYHRLMRQITDQQFVERTKAMIAELEAHKKALHPEQE